MRRERLDLAQLDTLLMLVESGTFSKAGACLGLAQSTVSQHLHRLEEAVGAPLIVRGQRGCKPTAAALQLLPYAKSLLRLEERTGRCRRPRRCGSAPAAISASICCRACCAPFSSEGGERQELVDRVQPGVWCDVSSSPTVDVALLEWWEERDGFPVAAMAHSSRCRHRRAGPSAEPGQTPSPAP